MRDIALSCVVDDTPEIWSSFVPWLATATRLAQFEADRIFVHHVCPLPPAIARLCETAGVHTRAVDRFDERCPHANKIQQCTTDFDGVSKIVLTDVDVVFTAAAPWQEIDAAVAGKVVDEPNPSLDVYRRVFSKAGVADPGLVSGIYWTPENAGTRFDTLHGNINGGLYVIDAECLPPLGERWAYWGHWLAAQCNLLDKWLKNLDQIAFCLAANELELPVQHLDRRWNFPLHLNATPEDDVVPYLIHHHGWLDEQLYVKFTGPPAPRWAIKRVNSAISAFQQCQNADASVPDTDPATCAAIDVRSHSTTHGCDAIGGELGIHELSPAAELMMCCARTHVDASTRARIDALLRHDIDWECLKRLAKKNRVLALVFHNLDAICAKAISPKVYDVCERFSREGDAYNKHNLAVLLEALALFHKFKIPVVPIKGVVFADAIYGDLGLRRVGDIDLFVHAKDFLDAKNMLVRHGHHQVHFGHVETAAAQSQLMRDDGGPGIDLHYDLSPRGQHATQGRPILERQNWNQLDTSLTNWFFSLDTEPMWNRLDTHEIAGSKIPVLATDDLFMVACIHGIKENWRCLNRLCDLAELVRARPELDWQSVLEQWRSLGCERKLFVGLYLAHHLLGMSLPTEVVQKMSASASVRAISRETGQLLCDDKTTRAVLEEFRLVAVLFTMDTWRDRLHYLKYIRRRLGEFSYNRRQSIALVWRLIRQLGDIALMKLKGSSG